VRSREGRSRKQFAVLGKRKVHPQSGDGVIESRAAAGAGSV